MSKKKSTIWVLLLAIVTIAFLPCLFFQKEKTEFTEPNEMLAVFLGEEKSKTFPTKESGYVYNRTECTNDEVATWDADTWKLTISKITKETKCNVYFTAGFTEQEFAYKGTVEEFTVPVSGNYRLEVWGAQGGQGGTYLGGAGGYSKGTVYLEKGTILYVYVGGKGTDGGTVNNKTEVKMTTTGGFNGGGDGYQSGSNGPRGAGGGATDFRIGEDTLYHRVIVAGGGGGGYYHTSSSNNGNPGGSTSSIDGTLCKAGVGTWAGSFGAGGTKLSGSTSTITGGGSGWYGGAGTNPGGGGSNWVYTSANFTEWQTGNPTDAANWKLDTKYYLADEKTIAGSASMPTHNGTATMIGNSGNGYAKITLVS